VKFIFIFLIILSIIKCGKDDPITVKNSDIDKVMPVITSLYPLNGDSILIDSLTFAWGIDSIDLSEVSVDLYLSQNNPPNIYQKSVEDSLFNLYFGRNSLKEGLYYWNIEVIYSGDTIKSPTMNFIYKKINADTTINPIDTIDTLITTPKDTTDDSTQPIEPNKVPVFDSTAFLPTNLSNLELTKGKDSLINFSWGVKDSNNDKIYSKMVLYNAGGNEIGIRDFDSSFTQKFSSDNFGNGTYFGWRIFATDGIDTVMSDIMTISVYFMEPNQVPIFDTTAFIPPHNSQIRLTGKESNLDFSWSVADFDGEEVFSKVVLYNSNQIAIDSTSFDKIYNNKFDINNFSTEENYFWKVISTDGKDTTISSMIKFKAVPNQAPIFDGNQFKPKNEDEVVFLNTKFLNFSCKATDGNSDKLYYQFLFYGEDKVNFSKTEFTDSANYNLNRNSLNKDKKYSWKVRVTDGIDTVTTDFLNFSFDALVWEYDSIPYQGASLRSVGITPSGKIVAAGKDLSYASIYISTDNGLNWSKKNVGSECRFLEDIFIVDENTYIVGGDYKDEALFRTTDGGDTWQKVGTGYRFTINHLSLDSITGDIWGTGWGYGQGSWIIHSTDKGLTWSKSEAPIDYPENIIAKNGELWLATSTTNIMHSTDGGATWNEISIDNGSTHIYFLDENTGWMTHSLGNYHLSKTTDGGVTWNISNQNAIGANTNDVEFMTDKIGFIAGDGGVYVTKDGGETWKNFYDPSYGPIYGLWFDKLTIKGRDVWMASPDNGYVIHATVPDNY